MDDSFNEPLDRERLQALYKEALEEHERFLNINQQLQKRLVQYFQEKKVCSVSFGTSTKVKQQTENTQEQVEIDRPSVTDQEAKYQALLDQLQSLHQDLKQVQSKRSPF